jgi:hypothetical protein
MVSDDTDQCPTEVDSKGMTIKQGMCGPGCPLLYPRRNECKRKTVGVLMQGGL